MRSLGVLATHPIQYYSPFFRHLANSPGLDLTVHYCLKPDSLEQGIGFGVPFQWDVDLLSGYRYSWLENRSSKPNLSGFFGCDTPGIKSIIREKKFDAFLVLGWANKSMWQAMRACGQTKTPLLVRGDSHLHTKTGFLKKKTKDLLYPRFMKRFDACLAVGQWSVEYFEHYGAKRIILSPHFVDNGYFEKRSQEVRARREDHRRSWNIPLSSTVFLFAGKFEEKKRPMDLLFALKRLFQENLNKENVHVLMVGDGALRAFCERYAKESALPVTFAGFLNQTQMPEAYASSDVLVLPSDGRETWGLVVNEAMSCGLPAIVSDAVGCGPDLIREEKTGHLYPSGDIEALAEKMKKLLDNKAISRMGEAARGHIQLFSVEQASAGLLEFIASSNSKR